MRYRSSTNNEDLPGFNGAGLYDSKTQDEDEPIDKSLKGVFASLWTFRAFTEREFHRIDHLAAAMGVLVHPNYKDELVNGVAVSFDPIYGSKKYYVNSQVGEDLVTNPDALSVPEEILLSITGTSHTVRATSNQVEPGELLMSNRQMLQLRNHLTEIHDHFKGLYNPAAGAPFAMEIEFKITSENILAIKQARPLGLRGNLDLTPASTPAAATAATPAAATATATATAAATATATATAAASSATATAARRRRRRGWRPAVSSGSAGGFRGDGWGWGGASGVEPARERRRHSDPAL